MILSGSIKWNPGGAWSVISDSEHAPIGFGSVSCLPDRVRVFYETPAILIHSVQVTPDEAFSSAGVRCGTSVGMSYLDIFFYMDGPTPVPPALLSKAGANVWITGHFTAAP